MNKPVNWRKPLIKSWLILTGSRLPSYYRQIKALEYASRPAIESLQKAKLERLLLHAARGCPYYAKILSGAGVERHSRINLEKFSNIPILTKEIIRREYDALSSRDKQRRHWYPNASGGSSGVPLRFIQDRNYFEWTVANTQYYKSFAQQDIGQSELRLWGSERDLLRGSESPTARLKNWLYHRRELNAFRMTPDRMKQYAAVWNAYQPRWVEAYVDALSEFVKFCQAEPIRLHQPKGVLVSAGTLYPFIREALEKYFTGPVFNRYGSREVGGVACSCERNTELHISVWNSYVEILDHRFRPVGPGQIGKVYVTTLNNYSMPLIRYDIGDYASWSDDKQCPCGRVTPRLQAVEGREMNVVKAADGTIVPAEFFIHFLGVVHNQGAFSKFQICQKSLTRIEVSVCISRQKIFDQNRPGMESSIKKVMGEHCAITWNRVADIPALPNGKYFYVISEI